MFGTMFSFFNEISTSFDAKTTKVCKKRSVLVSGVCKDHDQKSKDQKPILVQSKPVKTMAKKRVSFETKPILVQSKPVKTMAKKRVSFETKPIVYNEEKSCSTTDMKKGNELTVKILMTKEEAARLLAKCKDGGRLEFKDVAPELMQIPINRVNLVSSKDHSFVQDVDHKEH